MLPGWNEARLQFCPVTSLVTLGNLFLCPSFLLRTAGSHHQSVDTEGTARWYSMRLACVESWVRSLAHTQECTALGSVRGPEQGLGKC